MKNRYLILLVLCAQLSLSQEQPSIVKIDSSKEEISRSKNEILDRLLNNPNSMKAKDTTVKDITGLSYSVGKMDTVPKEFVEPATEENWDSTSLTYEEMEKEARIYYRKKYLKWGYIGIGICALIGAFFFIRKLIK